jgi:hypothetical protein
MLLGIRFECGWLSVFLPSPPLSLSLLSGGTLSLSNSENPLHYLAARVLSKTNHLIHAQSLFLALESLRHV